jgi:hypothetical protein
MKGKQQFRIIMNLRKNKLFHREKMQPFQRKDYLKVAAMCGVIVTPLLVGLFL